MAQVRIFGWKPGCNSVTAIKQIRQEANIPLNEALAIVNRVLNHEDVVVSVSSSAQAEVLINQLTEVGMIAEVVTS
jgi:hypothetical protein